MVLRTEIDKLSNLDYAKLLRVLILMETNSHLSASGSGLKERRKNRDEAIRLLQQVIEISDEKLKEMYNLITD